MSSILTAVNGLISSLMELVWSLFTTAGQLVQKTLSFALSLISGFVELIVNFFRGLIDLAGAIVSFFFGNILILILLGVAVVGFLQYQRSQSKKVRVGDKKVN